MMKIKITIPVVLRDGEEARITLYADLDAPCLSTTNLRTQIVTIDKPIIEVV